MPNPRILTAFGALVNLPEVSADGAQVLTTTGRAPAGDVGGNALRGRSIASTTPKSGEQYVWSDELDEWIPAGRVLHVEAFGAVADGVTDCAAAFEAAIEALDGTSGGLIQLNDTPGSFYRLSRTVEITRACAIVGRGANYAEDFAPTVVKADSGVTAFHVWGGGGPSNPSGAPDTIIAQMLICAAGKNTNYQLGTITAGATSLTLDAAGDFTNGQRIAIEGAGIQYPYQKATATTTNGSPTVTLAATGDQTPYAWIGMYLVIPGAYAAPARVSGVAGTTLTMESNASGTVTAGAVSWCAPTLARIVSGGGTTTLTIDTTLTITSMTNTRVTHADSAIVANNVTHVSHVSVGDGTSDFQGPALVYIGNLGDTARTKVANCATVKNVRVTNCRNALFVQGGDANASTFETINCINTREWGIVDGSTLGNTYLGCHAQGGAGYITQDVPGCRAVFLGCYLESGTYGSFGAGTLIVGGTMPENAGGFGISGRGIVNKLQVGGLAGQTHTTYSEPDANFWRLVASGSGGAWTFKKSATTGLLEMSFTPGTQNTSWILADDFNASDLMKGTFWIPSDFLQGTTQQTRAIDVAKAGRIATTTTGTTGPLAEDPTMGVMDTTANTTFGANVLCLWQRGDWVRDINLLDGCPTRHIIEDGHRAPEWAASTSYEQHNLVCPTVDNHNGSAYQKKDAGSATSGGTEPTWTSAPNVGDTVVDGGVTWTNIGAAAYTQPGDIGGRITKAIVGDETWTQTTRVFLCERVKLTGALGASATITMPAGRYKRWFWNATGQALLVKCATGRTITIANARGAWVGCDGSQMERTSADVDPTA